MRDKQAPAVLPSGRIPIISPVLHFLSMPVLVFWRRKFGYAYLSPKSVFLSTIFACSLFSYMVWNDPDLKMRYFALAAFGLSASLLYLVHLVTCIGREVERGSEHDQYSGASRLLVFVSVNRRQRIEGWVHGAIEPALTAILGLILWSDILGKLLFLFGFALACKELIRYWLGVRSDKRVSDSMDDAKNMVDIAQPTPPSSLSSTGRTGQEIYTRQYTRDTDEEFRYAEVLRMFPPYTLHKAETNASELIKSVDPDSGNAREQIRRINEALEYFRIWQD